MTAYQSEGEMREQQFANFVALSLKAYKTGNFADALYWLDGAKVLTTVSASHQQKETERENHSKL